jgi:hypothetical protein
VKARSTNPIYESREHLALDADSRWTLTERVARSAVLNRATQLRGMLLFIVRQSIESPEEPIHESEIAHRVLGRRSDFNPLDDNIVRVQMAHLRKKLDLYFSTEGKSEEVVITIGMGNYRPIFAGRLKAPLVVAPAPHPEPLIEMRHRGASHAMDARPSAVTDDAFANSTKPSIRHGRKLMLEMGLALVIAALVLVSIALWLRAARLERALDAMSRSTAPWRNEPSVASLWSRFIDSSRDTDVVISDDSFLLIQQISKHAFPFDEYLSRGYLSQAENKTSAQETQFVLGLIASKNLGNTSEFKLAQRVLSLGSDRQNVHLFSARQYMPALIKHDNAILIGGRVSNPWQALFESRLNFSLDTAFDNFGVSTVKNRAPLKGEQMSYRATDSEGYCVVAYMPNPSQDGKVLLIEGTSSEATEAAGDFFLSEDRLSSFLKRLPGPSIPYFEVLLKTSQVRGTPLTVTVEAFRVNPNAR